MDSIATLLPFGIFVVLPAMLFLGMYIDSRRIRRKWELLAHDTPSKVEEEPAGLFDPEHSASTMEMTISEAEDILDIVGAALVSKSQHSFHPISLLKGYDVFQLDAALKLRIANQFLILADTSTFEEKFSEAIDVYDGIPLAIATSFVPDDELEKLNRLPRDSSEYLVRNRGSRLKY